MAACGVVVAEKKAKEQIIDIDADDMDVELAVVEYIEDIHKFYKLTENETRPHDYMGSQPELNKKMRAILVDWLIEVHDKFELMPETLYLTINLIGRFLCVKMMPRRELQLVGISAMLIAYKYEEFSPEVEYTAMNRYLRWRNPFWASWSGTSLCLHLTCFLSDSSKHPLLMKKRKVWYTS